MRKKITALTGADPYVDTSSHAPIDVRTVAIPASEVPAPDIRHLPPGSVYDLWRQFSETHIKVSYRLFWKVFSSEFAMKLTFRGNFQHSVCEVCVKHKLLLKTLVHDSASRIRQRQLYDQHLTGQYKDRKIYWSLRAQSRLLSTTICIIIDGIDQTKFMWPKSAFFKSHTFDNFHRPKLHVTGALVHGYFALYTIADADCKKGSSSTVETLAIILQKLLDMGVELSKTNIHVQLDNTGGENKNNTVLMFGAFVVLTGVVATVTYNFLRKGHTHEDRIIILDNV